ncbi:polysaccharide biosynthesis/export family protein [Brevundimonas sp.]|uniref:polysaccharide biosynthesis/export family protein n=1 Tax=Brevundimonas sp. TaxID=1871086 RepID=UPI0035AEF084
MRNVIVALTAACVAGCGTSRAERPATGVFDAGTLQTAAPQGMAADYRIGPADVLTLSVFQVSDLSFEEVRVDASGALQLPLIGSIQAAGYTPAELSRELERRLGERFLRNPQVSVTVKEAADQKVTIDGAVTKPGVYEMRGRTTLLQAIAMAEGPTRTADLTQVAVFRTVDERRMVALFDLAQIRAGQMADPVMRGDDIVVVDSSRLNVAIREVLAVLPGLGIFAYF